MTSDLIDARAGAPAPAASTRTGDGRPAKAEVTAKLLVFATFVVTAFTLIPIVMMVLVAFQSDADAMRATPYMIPPTWHPENFARVMTMVPLGQYLLNTVIFAGGTAILETVTAALAAYAFARIKFRGREALFGVYLATLMIPQVVIVIPLYVMMAQTGLRNSFWALVLPFMFGSPYAVFLLREHFRSIPDDLIAAARIDGAGDWRILWQIVAPMSRGIIATLAIITVVSHWNNFMWPLIITTGRDWQVITVATANLQSQYNANWTLVMAATTVAMAPLLVIFAVFQRTIVNSISLTGFK